MCEIKMPKIKIVGIGGAGCNIVNLLLKKEVKGLEYFFADSTEDMLRPSSVETRIKLPATGSSWLMMAPDFFKAVVTDADMIVIISGLGGYVGYTFTPILAEVAKGMGIITIDVVVTAFEFEG